jgi:iron(III) transport system permease protein
VTTFAQRAGRRARFRRPSAGVAISLTVSLAVLGIGLALPLGMLLMTAFSERGQEALNRLLTNPVNQQIIINTIVLGITVATVGVGIAFLFAYVQARCDVPFKRVLHLIAILPVVSPPFALATSVIVLFGRNGVISRGIFGIPYDIYGLDGLTLVLALSFFPVVYLSLLGMLQRLDPSLDAAATDLGAGPVRIFRTITLPLMVPGLASGFLLLFVEAIADLANPLVLGGNFTVLSARAYLAISGEFDVVSGAVYSLSLLVPALLVFMLQKYWVERKSVATVTGKPSGSVVLTRGPGSWIAYGVVVFIAVLIVVIYTTIVIGSFQRVPGVNTELTLDHYEFILGGIGSQAMFDTTAMALIAAPIAAVLGVVIAWLVTKRLGRVGASGLDFLSMLGIAVPGTVLGIGVLLAFRLDNQLFGVTVIPSLAGGSALAGGALAIILVLVLRSLPAAVRTSTGALRQIHGSLDEASASLGAGEVRTFLRVTAPLIVPSIVAGLTFAVARSMTTLSPLVFLSTPDIKIMTSQILSEVDAGRFGNAFAYCVVLMSIVLTLVGLVQLINRITPRRTRRAKTTVVKDLVP